MAQIIHVAGKCLVTVGETALGYSIDGIDIAVQEFMEPVPGDENGGNAGPPIDVLKHGDLHIITMELSKWDDAVIGELDTKVSGGTAGTVSAGVLYRADSKFFSLTLASANFNRTYANCIPKGDLPLGRIGSRFSTKRLVFEAHAASDGTMWS